MDKLFKLTGFIPFILIIFLNAYVDLGHKILIQNMVFKIYDGQTQIILTAIVNGLILLPFVLLDKLRQHDNLYADIAAILAPLRARALRHLAVQKDVHGKILFGTDYPVPFPIRHTIPTTSLPQSGNASAR